MIQQSISPIYDEYLEQLQKSSRENRLSALTRLLTGRHDEEHLMAFDARLKDRLSVLASQNPDSRDVRELSEWMLGKAEACADSPYIKYSFTAVLRHLIPLTSFLIPADAAFLAARFEKAFPRRERFPALRDLIASLNEKCR